MTLQDLFISKVRVKILQSFLSNPNDPFHVRGLVRKTNEEINAVRRELARMENAGIVKKEHRGNRLYYWFRKDYIFYYDLLSLVVKTTELGKAIITNRNKLGKIKFAMLSGKFVRHLEREKDEVDFLIVGKVVLPELANIVREEESRREREINYTIMTEEEFEFRKRRHDPFITKILLASRVMLIGDEQEMVK
jgi:hypothetical protein